MRLEHGNQDGKRNNNKKTIEKPGNPGSKSAARYNRADTSAFFRGSLTARIWLKHNEQTKINIIR